MKLTMRWSTPPKGSCKFNMDGATKSKPGPAGIGVMIHDDRGRMILAFSEPLGLWSRLGGITFAHTTRSVNSVTYFLAKVGVQKHQLLIALL